MLKASHFSVTRSWRIWQFAVTRGWHFTVTRGSGIGTFRGKGLADLAV